MSLKKEIKSVQGSGITELHLSSAPDENRAPYPWKRYGKTWIKGYAYCGNALLTGKNLASLFADVECTNSFFEIMKNANGYFSVIIETANATYAAVDRVCSTPLMFRVNGVIEIGDDYKGFLSRFCQIDRAAIQQYLASGYSYGRGTLIQDVQQLPAGSILVISKVTREVKIAQYFQYIQSFLRNFKSQSDLLSTLHEVHLSVFERMVHTLKGRQAVVPLSGGYDSRLVVEMLARFNHRNVLCVSWGKKKNWEVEIARDVAQSLGMEWVRIENTRSQWWKWYKSGKFERNVELCGALTNVPYMQENILIENLKERDLVEDDAVFISGNSGDFIEGGHISQSLKRDKPEELLQVIKKKHMRLAHLKSYEEVVDVVRAEMQEFGDVYGTIEGFDEFWEWKERQSKFVSKSIKPFELNGFEWRMPFWDLELLNFWTAVPREVKKGRQLFYAYAERYMDNVITAPNPKISAVRRYFGVAQDGRYGCYLPRGSVLAGLLVSNLKISGYNLRKFIRHRPISLTRINGLLALDVCGKVLNSLKTREIR